ncbi:MAG: AI-2E family transporter [Chitinivibrionales bacterium]|nr:AI-2E family transporter [Chitinivibrionales bacterium]MBD3356305.1 AI-2E family transporter [Chitinivibrionales bacterium]
MPDPKPLDKTHPPLPRSLAVLAGVAIAFLALYLLRYAARVLLTAFAGVLVAVLLEGVARLLYRYTPIKRLWALVIVIAVLLALIGLSLWFVGPRIANQAIEFADRLPQAFDRIRTYLGQQDWGRRILETLPDQIGALSGEFISGVTDMVTRVATALTTALVMGVIGLFMAFNPMPYLRGLLHLIPQGNRETMQSVMYAAARALRRWLLARFLSMVVVGVLTGIGLAIVHVPLALTLGLIAGMLSFVPYLGPLLSVFPGIMVAFASDPTVLPWVIAVYIIVQLLESNFITPLIEQETTSVPAALLILVQVLLTLLIGAWGILLAAPLTVAATVFIQMLYVRAVLGDAIPVMGEHDS